MPSEILMPALSPTMEQGTLAKWLVQEGDRVSAGDLIAEIETDKAMMEFEAVDEGIIGKLLVAEGTQNVQVNSPIAILIDEGESADDIIVASAPVASTAAMTSPQETPKDISARPPEGVSPKDVSPEGVAPEGAPSSQSSAPAPMASAPEKNALGDTTPRVFATPLARRLAANKGIDLTQINGSGPYGRIIKADIENTPAHTQPMGAPGAASSPAQMVGGSDQTQAIRKMYEGRTFEDVTLDGMRKTIAARLSEAKQTVPHFYLRKDIMLDELLAFRGQINKTLQARGIKLSVNDFIIKACALALQQVPDANAVWAADRILKMQSSDVAVAVAIEGGLFTPVLQDADSKSLSSLSIQMKDLANRARARKLAPHEYQGGSFAISNLGMFGIDNFDAIINPPHAAILAVGAGVKKPVVTDDGEIGVATVMSTTLSVDHRVIDGVLGAHLLNAIKDNLENPIAMLA